MFKYRVLSVANNHIPKAAKKSANNRPPWWSSHLSKAIKEKQDLYSKYKFTLSLDDYAKYASKVKYMIRSAQALYDKSLMLKFKSNPNALYGYMRDTVQLKTLVNLANHHNSPSFLPISTLFEFSVT